MKKIKWIFIIMVVFSISIICYGKIKGISYVQAGGQSVQYTYDSLGRVKTATYPGKMILTYIYDKNGNLCDIQKEILDTGGAQSGTTQHPETTKKPNPSSSVQITIDWSKDPIVVIDPNDWQHSMEKELQAYNKFKKRTPVIKSLKQSEKKKKRYLKIKIKKLPRTGTYLETGYQIQYATNKKFKKAKSVTVKRSKKKSITSKKWTVKKKKTDYVRLRAYLVTKTGK